MCKEHEEHRHFVCECGKEFDNAISFGGHKASCKIHLKFLEDEREKRRLPNGLFKCENPGCSNEHDGSYGSGRFCSDHCKRVYCGKKTKNGTRKGHPQNHSKQRFPFGTWVCHHCKKVLNTKRELQNHIHELHSRFDADGNRLIWNKGLTKETSEAVRRNSESVSKTRRKLFEDGKLDAHKTWTAKLRKEQSERKKRLYKEHPEKHPNRKLANNRNKMSYPEKVAYDWLVEHNIQFEHQFNFKTEKFNRYVDFFCKEYNLFIEIDGEHWHQDTDKDKEKDLDAEKHGIKTLRISTKERIVEKLDAHFNL
jgi:very-short-patch-repair endonuclease